LNEVAKCESGTDSEAEWNTNLLDGLNIDCKNYFESESENDWNDEVEI
jgi:hypothetical protein